ncbi:MAG: hypothetical protein AB8G15_12960 [Saprospiraceae bacterium]
MPTNKIISFVIDGEVTRQQIGVYVIIAKSKIGNSFKLYIGKTGDNREGCNPIISRIGNHFSLNRIHSQMRNKLSVNLEEMEFEIIFRPFFNYTEIEKYRLKESIGIINEMERQLNLKLQKLVIGYKNSEIINKYFGKGYINKSERLVRKSYLTGRREEILSDIVNFIKQKINTEYN